ncbi:hypothetical protein Dalk_4449 [Desulfatibacillum aliphaticivorans]|uniref:Uncharacterized protein n=1 Tax=Desulfatibacillum aliphaticivorans TaxID=218208 RepID=B8FNF9_DESAL|nr:hypothetical protein Dalk_4449 [Desulfatibacillum aliphaticivorans]
MLPYNFVACGGDGNSQRGNRATTLRGNRTTTQHENRLTIQRGNRATTCPLGCLARIRL